MQRQLTGVGVVLLVWALGLPLAGFAAAASDEIRIGMNVALTGAFVSEADLYMKAVRLAEKQLNQTGGIAGKKLRLIVEDNQSTNPGALTALNKNLEQDKILALIGPVKSTQILAMADAVAAAGVPTMIGGTNPSLTTLGNPWLFRCRVNDLIVAAAMVKYIKEDMKLTKIGILHSAEAFGTGGADAVTQFAKERGLTIVAREKYTLGDKDFTAQLLKIKNAGAEVLIPYVLGHDDHAIVNRQYRQLGSPYKYISTPAIAMKDVLNLSREAAEGLVGVVEALPGQSEANSRYLEEYKKEYPGFEPDMLGAWVYDALKVLMGAIQKGGEDRAKIREALLATRGYPGVLGTFSFSKTGEGLHGAYVVAIEHGRPKLLKSVMIDQ
jgi:branched-chain amino acid transport system substrate-binding protein